MKFKDKDKDICFSSSKNTLIGARLNGSLKNYVILPIKVLRKATWNYKQQDESKQKKLTKNIDTFGLVQNIQVRALQDGLYEVVNGNHRLDSLKELGISHVIAYNYGTITIEQAMELAVTVNETRFETDYIMLSDIVNEIIQEETSKDVLSDLSEIMPFSYYELQSLQEISSKSEEDVFNIDFDISDVDFSKDPDEPVDELVKIKIGEYIWYEQPEIFEQWLEQHTVIGDCQDSNAAYINKKIGLDDFIKTYS